MRCLPKGFPLNVASRSALIGAGDCGRRDDWTSVMLLVVKVVNSSKGWCERSA
jgi:hypothetical protein